MSYQFISIHDQVVGRGEEEKNKTSNHGPLFLETSVLHTRRTGLAEIMAKVGENERVT